MNAPLAVPPAPLPEPLALAPEAVAAFTDVATRAQRAAMPGNGPADTGYYLAGNAAVVPVIGMLWRGAHLPTWGLSSYGTIRAGFEVALADAYSTAVVLHLSSQGGVVDGLFALVDAMRDVRADYPDKPVIALVDETALSAAYAIATVADRIVLASETAQVGSVGVIAAHVDQSGANARAGLAVSLIYAGAHKADGNPHEPLPDDVRADVQRDLDRLYAGFLSRVALGRGVPEAAVRETEARTYRGPDALAARLADEISPPDALLASLTETASENPTMTTPARLLPGARPAATPPTGGGDAAALATLDDCNTLARAHGLDDAARLRLIDRAAGRMTRAAVEAGLTEAAAALDLATYLNPTHAAPATFLSGHNATTMDNPAALSGALGEALHARVNPSVQLSGPARLFAGASIADAARAVLARHGHGVMGSPAMLINSVMAAGFHTRSDFTAVLAEFARRSLRDAYEAAPSGIRQVARETTATDFRTIQRIALGEFPALAKVNEHGEFTSGTVSESAETYRVETYGKIVGLTRQALVNDDLMAFADLTRRAGAAARELEAKVLADLIVANPLMSDGIAFFAAGHNNLAGAGTTIEAGLSAARAAMRVQKGLDGVSFINAAPRFLLVGPARETEAERAVASITPTTTAAVNVFSNLSVVVEPRITGNAWMLFSDPSVLPALEFAYLSGAGRPDIETDEGFEIDGVRMRVRLDFGAGLIEWRAAFRNPGA